MSYPTLVGTTTVDCHKQVRSWRLLRSLAEVLIPTCNCFITQEDQEEKYYNRKKYLLYRKPSFNIPSSTVTGTLFGYRHGKVSFCIQTRPKSLSPILLLELSIPTSILAKEMKLRGSVRIALECNKPVGDMSSLLSVTVWTMYCNGKKVGSAIKREDSVADYILRQVENVAIGAGIIKCKNEDVMYLRGKFERIHSSSNSESFHLVDIDGNIGQELSFYFLRSQL
ncbi:hypothetical protein ACJIZ3_002544 [Penstemon smallii]|uniref:Protein MIZU-KUSSEI 1-like n=1 Tax=Penstemon smallii TaxID=265156 RepID=A0ABD3U885_9LAMI